MGYTTDFEGKFAVTPTLKPEHAAYLRKFSETRRMRRYSNATANRPDPIREAVDLPVGHEGCFFVGEEGMAGQGLGMGDRPPDVMNYNSPPTNQPGLWCQWTPNAQGDAIVWDGGEKFYDYTEWLVYLIRTFLQPWGYSLTGAVGWAGEEADDRGTIYVKNNKVEAVPDSISNPGPSWGIGETR